MYMRLTTTQMPPEQLDTMVGFFQQRVGPAMQQQPGFQSTYVLVDRATGKGGILSVWESEDALRQAETMLNQQRAEGGQAVQATVTPTSEVYEVAFQM
jgi:heme-degrading monooxygenase HmoA